MNLNSVSPARSPSAASKGENSPASASLSHMDRFARYVTEGQGSQDTSTPATSARRSLFTLFKTSKSTPLSPQSATPSATTPEIVVPNPLISPSAVTVAASAASPVTPLETLVADVQPVAERLLAFKDVLPSPIDAMKSIPSPSIAITHVPTESQTPASLPDNHIKTVRKTRNFARVGVNSVVSSNTYVCGCEDSRAKIVNRSEFKFSVPAEEVTSRIKGVMNRCFRFESDLNPEPVSLLSLVPEKAVFTFGLASYIGGYYLAAISVGAAVLFPPATVVASLACLSGAAVGGTMIKKGLEISVYASPDLADAPKEVPLEKSKRQIIKSIIVSCLSQDFDLSDEELTGYVRRDFSLFVPKMCSSCK